MTNVPEYIGQFAFGPAWLAQDIPVLEHSLEDCRAPYSQARLVSAKGTVIISSH